VTKLFAKEQSYKSMLKILGYWVWKYSNF
jgi:hypothetical protein